MATRPRPPARRSTSSSAACDSRDLGSSGLGSEPQTSKIRRRETGEPARARPDTMDGLNTPREAGVQGPSGPPMTETQPPVKPGSQPAPVHVQTRITVDDPHVMVKLLGAGDELLRLVERSVASDVHVRGNQITITGQPADNALAERIFSELLELIQKGETLTADAVR